MKLQKPKLQEKKQRERKMSAFSNLTKVNDNMTINRYDNGWMVEVSGRTEDDDWTTVKLVCTSEEGLHALIHEYNNMEINK